jgi:heat shock protein HslJ
MQAPSLENLAGTEWVLRQWDEGEPAPAEPAVTLQLEEGHFVGRSGCNRYSASVREGTGPGTLTVGNPIATKMLCRPPQMEVEFRFLQQLSQVHAFGCAGASLTLTYQKDGATGVMRFERKEANEGGAGGTPTEKIPG